MQFTVNLVSQVWKKTCFESAKKFSDCTLLSRTTRIAPHREDSTPGPAIPVLLQTNTSPLPLPKKHYPKNPPPTIVAILLPGRSLPKKPYNRRHALPGGSFHILFPDFHAPVLRRGCDSVGRYAQVRSPRHVADPIGMGGGGWEIFSKMSFGGAAEQVVAETQTGRCWTTVMSREHHCEDVL